LGIRRGERWAPRVSFFARAAVFGTLHHIQLAQRFIEELRPAA
jgi:hypothetical protein